MENTYTPLAQPCAPERLAVLQSMVEHAGPQARPDVSVPAINLHAHTIYSYSGYGYSPSDLAWLALSRGWYALGTVDFDVFAGAEETLAACEICGVRGATGFETRVQHAERAGDVFNSPGEPGVMYYVGMGLASGVPAPAAAETIADMAERAQARNREMIERVNAYLSPVAVDYCQDVLPLTPAGNATERHMLLAYDAAARRAFPRRPDLLAFWASRLGLTPDAVSGFLGDTPFPHDAIRSRLMKQGGPGYVAPGPESFPPLDAIIAATVACGALPCYAFLDGTSSGEQDMASLLEQLIAHGILGLVAIPDRNWNVPDAERSRTLAARFHATLQTAAQLDLPVFIGTEMNKPGQLQMDDLSVPALRPYVDQFRAGADLLYVHTALARGHDLGYHSTWAQSELPSRRERTRFYAELGRLLAPGNGSVGRAAALMSSLGARGALASLKHQAHI